VYKSSAPAGTSNVVDVAVGSAATESGFTGDTNVSTGTDAAALPISPASFKLVSGSGAANILPGSLPSGYPATDFYGDAISAEGAAGAVQSSED
jgi:hypothetical protein